MSEIAVAGCSFSASIDSTLGTISALLSTSTQPSNKVLVQDKGVHKDKITVILATGSSVLLTVPPEGAASPTGVLLEPQTIAIEGTAENVLVEGKKAVQKNDEGTASITFYFPDPNGTPTITSDVDVTVKVSNAGQSVVIVS